MRLVPNPAWAGKRPKAGGEFCHDGTPFLTISCDCGNFMHLHEGQLPPDDDAILVARCPVCGGVHELRVRELRDAIRQAWEEEPR